MTDVDRRNAIVCGAAALAVVALPSCSPQPSGAATKPGPHNKPPDKSASAQRPLASLAKLPHAAPFPVNDPESGAEAYLIRRGADVVMRTATCTHQGCIVAWFAAEHRLRCPCHGATYDAWSGRVLSGPAPLPLREIPTRVRAGMVYRA